jgi:hypothetical protein
MFRAREAEHRVVYGYQEVSMGSLETASQRSFVQILDDIVANELPKLARRNPDTSLVTHHFCGMFAGAGQTDTSKNFALSGNLHRSNFWFI